MTDPKFDRQGNEIKPFLVRLTKQMDDRVRERAYRDHTTKADIIRRSLEEYLDDPDA